MKFLTFFLFVFTTTAAIAADYEIEFSLSGTNPVIRKEIAYRKGIAGLRQAFQSRAYVNDTNELEGAAFLQKNGKWVAYAASELPAPLLAQVEFVNKSSSKNPVSGIIPTFVLDAGVKKGEMGNPVLLPIPAQEKIAESSLKCQATSPGFVTCGGELYKKVEDGPISATGKTLKDAPAAPSNSTPKIDPDRTPLPAW